MKLRSLVIGCVLAAAFSAQAGAVELANAGFETGDLAGWTFTPDLVEVVTGADSFYAVPPLGAHFAPVEGGYFARLSAGLDPGDYTILSQAFDVSVASRLSGFAAFLAFDSLPYDDDAYVRVYAQGADQPLFSSSVGELDEFGFTPWTRFTSGVLLPGETYVLEAGVRDVLDFGFSSQLLLDDVTLTAAVPEPATWALMIGGFGLAGAMLRRRRNAVA